MSKKDQKEINLAIYTIAAYLKRYIDAVNIKFKELMKHVNSVKSDDDVKTLMELKKNQEALSKAFQEFKLEFSEPDELVILINIKVSIKDLKANFESYRRVEDYLNKRSNELMIKFRKSEHLKEYPGVQAALKRGLFSKSGRKAKEGSGVLMQAFEMLKIQEGYESGTRKGQEGGGVLMEGLKLQEECVMNDGIDIGGQRENVSDSKSLLLEIERFLMQDDYVSETSKSEGKGEVSMEGLKTQEDCVMNDGIDIGGQIENVSDSKSMELEIERFKTQEDEVSETLLLLSKSGREVEEGSSVLMQAVEGIKIQEDYVSETSKSERKGKVLMEGLKIQEDHVMNDGSDIGGQRENVSDSESMELGIERFKIQEDYVSEKSKSERKVEVLMEGLKIQEGYVENKMNDGSDIGGQREDVSDSKSTELGIERFKIQEEYLYQRLNELAPAFDRSGHGSDVNLEKITESGTSNDLGACTNIEGLEQKICSLISEAKCLLKEDKDNEKNSLIDWIKILKATKDRSVELGTELCLLLVDLRFIMSEREELMAKFQEFKSSLEFFSEEENFMVINKMIEVLEMTDGEMRKMEKKEKLDERLLNVSEVKEGLIEVSQVDHLLVSILNEVLNLGYVLMHPRLPDLNMSKKDIICLEELKAIDAKIAELKESSTVIFGSEEMKRVEFHTKALQGRIKEMWNQFGESLEENEPRID